MRTARTSGCSRGYTVRWTIRSSHAACDPESEVSTSGEGWETDAFDVSLSYWYRKLVRFTRRQLRADAILTLSVEFDEAWDYGYGRTVRCRKTSRFRGRCRFSWIIGDGVYQGWMRSRRIVRRRPNRSDLVAVKNRGRVKLTDEYCLYTGGSNCVRYVRIQYY